jgi:hypothetical protein
MKEINYKCPAPPILKSILYFDKLHHFLLQQLYYQVVAIIYHANKKIKTETIKLQIHCYKTNSSIGNKLEPKCQSLFPSTIKYYFTFAFIKNYA